MTNVKDLAAEINRQLALYASQTDKSVRQAAEKVAQDGAEKLRAVSPRNSGDYAESWTYKEDKVKQKGLHKFVVHNKDHYRLTHLIEKSYVKRNGERTTPRPHIKPVEKDVIVDYENELRRGLS